MMCNCCRWLMQRQAHGLMPQCLSRWAMVTSIKRFYSVSSKPAECYVLQRVNSSVYCDIDLLMKQTRTVLKRLSAVPDFVSEYRLPELISTQLGDPFFVQRTDGEEHSWRLWRFIAGSRTCDPTKSAANSAGSPGIWCLSARAGRPGA